MCKNSSYYALWLVKNYSRDLQHPIRAISDWQSMLCWHSCMTLAHAYWVNGREYSRKLLPFVKPTFGILLEHHQVLPTKYIGNSTVASSQLSQFLLSSSANNWGCNNRSNNNNSSNNKKTPATAATSTTAAKKLLSDRIKVEQKRTDVKCTCVIWIINSLKKSIEIWNHFSRKIFFWRTKFCCNFFPFLSSIATLIHFPGVTNAFGPSHQPTACRSPTLSLMTATGNNQAQGKVYTYLVVLILIILIIFYLAKLMNQWSML